MRELSLIGLPWLPKPPQDFRDRLRAAKARSEESRGGCELWNGLKALAAFGLDEVQLAQVARAVAGLRVGSGAPDPLRLGVMGGGTLSLAGPAIVASALRQDLRVEVLEGDFGSAVTEALDPGSAMRRAELDALLVAFDCRSLALDRAKLAPGDAEAAVEAAFLTIRTVAENMRPAVKGAILVQTVAPPMDALFGALDAAVPGSPYAQVQALNLRLLDWAREAGVVAVDVARLAATVGLEFWDDPGRWHNAKFPLSPDAIPLYADVVARTLGAVRGKARKCLVLDLDNTLWGGVIGDDGVAGIRLGQGSATGEAFLAIQRSAFDLRERGVILAVCSKNEDDAARLPFRHHDEMVLRENHIAVFQANWTDKAANLKVIAESLNIGLDALVFLDDNPFEREQVRGELPMVAVPELPEDPALYPRMLLAAGYFEALSFGEEDRQRAGFYQSNAERAALQASATDLTSYLASLDMLCSIRPFDEEGRARIAQLINKSNQFNLTTRRYTEAEVKAISEDPNRLTMQIRLTDRLGDNGMISVLICERLGEAWEIDTWLMSCRVLGRRVEEAALASVVRAARADGASRLVGRYAPSAKNRMVAEHYGKLGFAKVSEDADGASTWELSLSTYDAPTLPMRIDDGTSAPHALSSDAA